MIDPMKNSTYQISLLLYLNKKETCHNKNILPTPVDTLQLNLSFSTEFMGNMACQASGS